MMSKSKNLIFFLTMGWSGKAGNDKKESGPAVEVKEIEEWREEIEWTDNTEYLLLEFSNI